jgi:hypothetical protein
LKDVLGGVQLRFAADRSGLEIGIERLDQWPQLSGRLGTQLVTSGAQVEALHQTMTGVRIVLGRRFTRTHDVVALARDVCYSLL